MNSNMLLPPSKARAAHGFALLKCDLFAMCVMEQA